MAGQTSAFDLPYPDGADPPDGAAQIRALAEAVDAAMPLIQGGTVTVTWSSSQLADEVQVTFDRAYSSTPAILVTSGSGWVNAAYGVASPTGFRVRAADIRGPQSYSGNVSWVAIGDPA